MTTKIIVQISPYEPYGMRIEKKEEEAERLVKTGMFVYEEDFEIKEIPYKNKPDKDRNKPDKSKSKPELKPEEEVKEDSDDDDRRECKE